MSHMTQTPNLQRMVLTGARVGRHIGLRCARAERQFHPGLNQPGQRSCRVAPMPVAFLAVPCHQALMQNHHFGDSFTKACRQPKASQG